MEQATEGLRGVVFERSLNRILAGGSKKREGLGPGSTHLAWRMVRAAG